MAENLHESDLSKAKELINVARLEESDLQPVIQPLYTASEFCEDLKLIEVNSGLLDKIMEGQMLTIRGEPGESAVICTDTQTFVMKEAETSNALLLFEKISWPEDNCTSNAIHEKSFVPQEIVGIIHTYFELRPCRPRLKKLRELLSENLYYGKEYEEENVGRKYTFEDLLSVIQASEEELTSGLMEIQACIIDGFWRCLGSDYHFRIFSHVLNLIDSDSLPLNKIPKKFILDTLEELESKEILQQCFSWYTVMTGQTNENGDELYALKEDLVCRFYAEYLLRAAGKFHLQEFLESWQRSIPEGMTSDLSQLEGLAIVDLYSRPESISYFPVWDLPENVDERFNALFRKQSKWTYNEICPYIRDRVIGHQNVNTLLTKFSRASMCNGVKVYSAKWPIM